MGLRLPPRLAPIQVSSNYTGLLGSTKEINMVVEVNVDMQTCVWFSVMVTLERPDQVVIVPILKKNADTEAVLAAADSLAQAAKAAGLRAKVDAGTEKTPGFKFSYWEMKVHVPSFFHQSDRKL